MKTGACFRARYRFGRTMKIVENNGQYKITLPKDLVLDKAWKAGDELRFVEDVEGRIFLKVIPRESAAEKSSARNPRKN